MTTPYPLLLWALLMGIGRHAAAPQQPLLREGPRRLADWLRTPAVRDATKRAMIQELIKKQLDEKMSGADIADSELKAFYDAHVDDYVKPERARVYHAHHHS